MAHSSMGTASHRNNSSSTTARRHNINTENSMKNVSRQPDPDSPDLPDQEKWERVARKTVKDSPKEKEIDPEILASMRKFVGNRQSSEKPTLQDTPPAFDQIQSISKRISRKGDEFAPMSVMKSHKSISRNNTGNATIESATPLRNFGRRSAGPAWSRQHREHLPVTVRNQSSPPFGLRPNIGTHVLEANKIEKVPKVPAKSERADGISVVSQDFTNEEEITRNYHDTMEWRNALLIRSDLDANEKILNLSEKKRTLQSLLRNVAENNDTTKLELKSLVEAGRVLDAEIRHQRARKEEASMGVDDDDTSIEIVNTSQTLGDSRIPPSELLPGPSKELDSILDHFEADLLPLCEEFIASPPTETKKLEDEHRKLSETILQDVLPEIDEVRAGGDIGIRTQKKVLVSYMQDILKQLDGCMPESRQMGTNNQDSVAFKASSRFQMHYTISKDCTGSSEDRTAALLGEFGKRLERPSWKPTRAP